MKELFKEAIILVQNLDKTPTNTELLQLYGLYKQATIGDNNKDEPSMFYVKEKSKWESWNKHLGKSKEDVMKEYIILVGKLIEKYS